MNTVAISHKPSGLNLLLSMCGYSAIMSLSSKFDFALQNLVRALLAAVVMAIATVAMPAYGQSISVSNSPVAVATIDGTTTCTGPASPRLVNFVVTNSFTLSDVNIGILTTHTWRGDLQFTLVSPTGTRVQLTNGDTNALNGDNFNVLLDDAATSIVNTDGNTVNHTTTAPPYQNTFRPNNLLSAFNTQNSAGTWTLEICDLFPTADNGTFQNATLYLMGPSADLSLAKTVSNATPANGTAISYTLTVSSAATSSGTATGVQVRDILPAGFTFVSASGVGSYNSITGVWTVGNVPVGASRAITINGTVNATSGAVVVNNAEIIASSLPDPDSTVNNGVTTEDDYATRSFTVGGTRVAGTPPSLASVCPAGNQLLFDWQGRLWTNATNNTYNLSGLGDVNWALSSDVAFVTGSPTINTTNTGGFGATEQGLFINLNNTTVNQQATAVINLPNTVPGLQFRIFDIDFGNGSFADKITVVGSNGGTTVMPVLTNGIANYVIGNTAIGDAASDNASADGNVVVTFTSPVDKVTILYGNHTTAPADPGNQFMTIHDVNFCRPVTDLGVTKISTVLSDPVNGGTNPKAIPGAIVEYTFGLTNPGSASAQSVVITDNKPADMSICVASIGGAGPVVFTDGSPASGLSYSYTSLASTTDNLEFSNNNGTSWTYVPTADANGCDAAITSIRINPTGSFAASRTASFKARFRLN